MASIACRALGVGRLFVRQRVRLSVATLPSVRNMALSARPRQRKPSYRPNEMDQEQRERRQFGPVRTKDGLELPHFDRLPTRPYERRTPDQQILINRSYGYILERLNNNGYLYEHFKIPQRLMLLQIKEGQLYEACATLQNLIEMRAPIFRAVIDLLLRALHSSIRNELRDRLNDEELVEQGIDPDLYRPKSSAPYIDLIAQYHMHGIISINPHMFMHIISAYKETQEFEKAHVFWQFVSNNSNEKFIKNGYVYSALLELYADTPVTAPLSGEKLEGEELEGENPQWEGGTIVAAAEFVRRTKLRLVDALAENISECKNQKAVAVASYIYALTLLGETQRAEKYYLEQKELGVLTALYETSVWSYFVWNSKDYELATKYLRYAIENKSKLRVGAMEAYINHAFKEGIDENQIFDYMKEYLDARELWRTTDANGVLYQFFVMFFARYPTMSEKALSVMPRYLGSITARLPLVKVPHTILNLFLVVWNDVELFDSFYEVTKSLGWPTTAVSYRLLLKRYTVVGDREKIREIWEKLFEFHSKHEVFLDTAWNLSLRHLVIASYATHDLEFAEKQLERARMLWPEDNLRMYERTEIYLRAYQRRDPIQVGATLDFKELGDIDSVVLQDIRAKVSESKNSSENSSESSDSAATEEVNEELGDIDTAILQETRTEYSESENLSENSSESSSERASENSSENLDSSATEEVKK
ncbi:hypothetical protein BZA70DRAFT_161926 [Myxozyma melibiosi]|uniref:Uncharacterized protein n=1 Tax=Myxozyma melibiosi TaxID=54550 RepID=A0ABR1F8Q0_9ASCO